MAHRIIGALHARLLTLRDDAGQGTVEYVALILLIAVILGAAVAAMHKDQGLGTIIVSKIKDAITSAGSGK